MNGLRRALAARGIRGRLADRIEAELDDHLACDPQARLGAPEEIAERFAAELRGVRTRRASLGTVAALALTAILLAASGQSHASAAPWAGLLILAGGQTAFVAAMLAVLRAWRGTTVGDLRLVQRRATVALLGGTVVAAGLAADGRAVTIVFAAVSAVALVVAAHATLRAARLTPPARAAGLTADFGSHAALILLVLAAIAVAGVVFQGVAFEGSGWEGVIRGAIEASGLLAGVAVLGRPLGLRA